MGGAGGLGALSRMAQPNLGNALRIDSNCRGRASDTIERSSGSLSVEFERRNALLQNVVEVRKLSSAIL
jgi:hypothetical protein